MSIPNICRRKFQGPQSEQQEAVAMRDQHRRHAYFSRTAAARACLDPFVPIFLRHHGLTALQAGFVLSAAAHLLRSFRSSRLWIPRYCLASSVARLCATVPAGDTPTRRPGGDWVSPCRVTSELARGKHTDVDSTDGSIALIQGGHWYAQGEAKSSSGKPFPAPSPTYELLPTAVPLDAGPATSVVARRNGRQRTCPTKKATLVGVAMRVQGTASPEVAKNASKDVPSHSLDGVVIPVKDKKGMPSVPAANPDCQGDRTSPDCPAGPTDHRFVMDNAALLLLAAAVVLGSSTFALAKFVADESYFAFLDEIDATEKSRSHETYAAVVTALVLGAVAILASQTPCLPLPTWGFRRSTWRPSVRSCSPPCRWPPSFPSLTSLCVARRPPGRCRGVGSVLKNVEGALIVGGLVFLGLLAGLEQAFFMWHLEETGKKVELGVVLMARAVSNVASLFLLCAGGLPSRLLAWLAFGIVCVAARCACYVQSGWELAAVAQLLSPPSTVLVWVACERWARRSSTRLSTERGLLVVMRCCHNGLGFCVGALAGGGIAAWLGVRTTLGVGAVVGIISGLAMLAASRFVAGRPPSYDRLLWDPTSANSDSESEEEPKMAGDAGVPVTVTPVTS
ncbi:hypothetical protein HPB52_012433 [Rhipicephalus sanguineus]|uniref:Major facilitator superfamily associated domain-containing protein n=1 Tax=Rhipicephalus sanguineus TaxID=34632 RepID=A0A9D4PLH3_RHISA|nr:hypothetical protein HPB52_012433 [Rhipicephalus sanguineus]